MSAKRFNPGDLVWVVVPDREGLRGEVVRNLQDGHGLPMVGCVTVLIKEQKMIVAVSMLRKRTASGPGSLPPSPLLLDR